MDAEFASPQVSRTWAPQARLALWVTAIREAYVALLPLTVVGALALSLASVPYRPFIEGMNAWFGPAWMRGALLVFQSTMGMMGLLGAMSVAARTMTLLLRPDDSREARGMATVASVAAAVFVLSVWSTNGASLQSLGYASAFQSLVVGVATAEVIRWLNHRLPLHTELNVLDTGVSLRESLHLTVTAGLALLLVGGGYYLCASLLGRGASGLLPHLVPWLQSWGSERLNMAAVLFNQLLWMIGVNGGQWFLHLASAGSSLMAPGDVLWSDAAASPMFMNAFAHLGGAGATWGLILYCAFRGRDPSLRKLALYSIVPALFNVNELLLFGIPLVLSRSLLLPFILAPLANCALSLLALRLGFIVLDGQGVPWSMPMLVSGYLMTQSWHGTLVQLTGLALSTAIYAPFLRQLERLRAERHGQNLKTAMNELMRERTGESTRLLDRPDAVGAVARCLRREFQADLGSPRVTLAYQPQHGADGRVVGVEALLRWTHASFGPIPPAAIINIAEECELIHDIGTWVVDRACADTRRWRDSGFAGFKVSINMSPRQLEDPGWAATVGQALRRHGVSPQDLDIEITEGQSLSSSPQSERTLQALQAMGVALSMDDFGMGCTSLLYMHRFHLHSIKLDGRLTREVVTNEVDRDIVRCIAGLGYAQQVHVIAEFVETAEQQAMLQELGCDMFQGWHYSPVIAAADLTSYVGTWEQEALDRQATLDLFDKHRAGSSAVPQGAGAA